MIALIDYGAGNVESVAKALRHLGHPATLTADPTEVARADAVVLPGVGAFGDAVGQLRARGLESAVAQAVSDSERPFLGICVGLQMLFDSSEESPETKGLSCFGGKVLRIPSDTGLKVPHMGWNSLSLNRSCPLFADLPEEPFVYFVHSYYLKAEDEGIVCATTEYGVKIHAAIHSGSCFATQFHPEKSGEVGLAILENFCSMI